MFRLQVDDNLAQTLILSVAPLVREHTGWDLRIPLLRWRVIPRERCYEDIYLGRIRGAGIPVIDGAPRTLNQRLTQYLMETGTLAAYEPSCGEVIVIRENVDEGNIDGLRLVLAHELVHRAQHVRFPDLFTRIDETIRNLWFASVAGPWRNPVRERAMLDRAMSVLESHAAYVQEKLREEHYPLARIHAVQSQNVSGLLLRTLKSEKMSQYTRLQPQIEEAARQGLLDDFIRKLYDSVR